MAKVEPLSPEQACRRCDPDAFDFETTAELAAADEVLGQDRALEALRFGIAMARDGFNLYALGPPGLGKHAIVRRIVEGHAAAEPVPVDWCYVNNFADSQKPRRLSLPPGVAARLKADMEHLVQDLRAAISAAFEGDDYRNRKEAIEEGIKQRHEKALEAIQEKARENGIALIRSPAGLGFAPVRDGEVIGPEAFEALDEAERKRIQSQIEALQGELQTAMRELPALVREGRRRLRELDREVTQYAVAHLIDELRETYAGLDEVLGYLDAVQADVIEHTEIFRPQEEAAAASMMGGAPAGRQEGADAERYAVNLLVDRGGQQGAPVVYEDHPTFGRLIGEIEHTSQFGALTTNFTLIKPGALLRANGGYLLLDARRLLTQPYAYEGLKQALRARCLRIESPGQALSLISTRGLEPQPIPLDVKVVIIGEPMIYYLLSAQDPEFGELFKVAADFDDQVERDDGNARLYARLMAQLAADAGIKPLDRGGVARALEHGARLAGDAERLSLRTESLADLLREADHWAGDKPAIEAADVQRAIDAQVRRANRVQERMAEQIIRGTVLIDTAGEKVGQINGLSVLQLGGYAFGKPSRVTARVRLGRGEVIDIERRVELGGPLHSKGVLILSGYLGERYAAERPLSLAASLVFEQSYGGVDGDSASSTELYAILSALARTPIRQSLAVTGSVNQRGEVQAIGGVNEKIEGFFDVCAARGLSGDQGVLIPASNVKHLMLRGDVVEAIRAGTFHIYPIETIDQGIEVLTGVPAGEPDDDGGFPEGTINRLVETRLAHFAEKARAFGGKGKDDEYGTDDDNDEAPS